LKICGCLCSKCYIMATWL